MRAPGFRPGSRGPFDPAQDRPFVSAKVAKTIDAPPDLIGVGGRKIPEGGLTRYAQTKPADL